MKSKTGRRGIVVDREWNRRRKVLKAKIKGGCVYLGRNKPKR